MAQFKKIGVVGAGTMGSGIVQKIAQENIPVVMVDVKQEFVDKGLGNIKTLLDEGIQRKLFSTEKVRKILSNIKGTTDINELKDADIIIEAVFEDEKVKKDLFQTLDKICAKETILASNTSSYKIADLATATKRPDRFVGLHYFYHPAKNRLLEIIPGPATAQGTVEIAEAFSNITGKSAITVKDSPGFAVNRFFVPWLNEAVRVYEEGVANIPTIEEAAKRAFKIGMGPFLLMNVTGIPIAYHSTETLGKALGKFYATAGKLKEQFEKGVKWDLTGSVDESKIEAVKDQLLGAVFLAAGQIVQEQVASVEDTDRGAKIGLRWALGPFELMNKIGLKKADEILTKTVQKYGVTVPKVVDGQFKSGKPWFFRLVDLSAKDNVATITINRPEAMNALNEEVVRQLDEAFTKAEANERIKIIILEGKGKAFVAGADIGFFVKKIKDKKIGDIVDFTKKGQDLLLRIDKSPKTIVAKIDGLALGGGAELALACDIIIMTERANMGFPETGIGIYPGLAGTQRLPRLVGKALAKYLIFTGEIINAKQAQEMGMGEYVSVAELDKRVKELISQPNPKSKYLQQTIIATPEVDKLRSIFSDARIKDVLSNKLLTSPDQLEAKVAKKVSFKAPVAIKLANQIIDDGFKVNIEEGIKIELNHLTEIFSTADAYEGLSSILERRRPNYKGA
ncbi:MAG: enoyl-CoA hydratase/isomerase family protein [Planctomycetes bacterium]|nr:enoyl-CoA hydratase/isomerase family protein [Planctomycetota bacterium]